MDEPRFTTEASAPGPSGGGAAAREGGREPASRVRPPPASLERAGRSALATPCPQCARRVAPGAARCPSCGAPLLIPDDPVPRPLDREVELDAAAPPEWAEVEVSSRSEPDLSGLGADDEDDAWVRPGAGLGPELPAAAFESALDGDGLDPVDARRPAALDLAGEPAPIPPPMPARTPTPTPKPTGAATPPPMRTERPGRTPTPTGASRRAAATTSPAAPVDVAAEPGGAAALARPAALDELAGSGAVATVAAPREAARAGAPIALRLRAFAVDAAVVLAATVLPALLAARGLPAGVDALAAVGPPALGLVALAAFTYSVVAQATLGATPGQRLLGLRVTRLDGGALGFGEAALRAALAVAGTAAFGVGLLPALRGGRGRGLHDVVARTVVVLAP